MELTLEIRMTPTASVSVATSVSTALEHTERILFRPFNLSKWFVLGFSAFLASLGSGGGYSGNWRRWQGREELVPQEVRSWVLEHLPLVIGLGIAVLLLIIALTMLFQWLSSRGTFMFLDGIVRDRAEVSEPWRRFRSLGNRLFVFRFLAGLAVLGGFLVIGLGIAGLAWFAIHRGGCLTWVPAALLGGLALLFLLAAILFFQVLEDFGVPVMYRLDLGPSQALSVLRQEVMKGRGWDFTRFYLLKFVLAMGAAILVIVAGCLTCCIGFLPYLSSVLTLPVSVFFRCYALDLLRQIDPRWDLLNPGPQAEAEATI